MRLTKLKITKCLYLIFMLNIAYSQKEVSIPKDSLENKSYDYLLDRLDTLYYSNKKIANVYLSAYLNKAKKERDTTSMIKGYYLIAGISAYKKSLDLINLALSINKHRREPNNYLNILLYILQGTNYYMDGKYNIAVDSFLKAKKYLNQDTNPYFKLTIDYSIGVLKWCLGDYQNSLKIHQLSFREIQKNKSDSLYSSIYLDNIMSLCIVNRHLKKLDSSIYYAKQCIMESRRLNNTSRINKAKINIAMVNYERNNYQQALDTLLKYIPTVPDTIDLAITRMFTGKTYLKLNRIEQALIQLKKVDSLVSKTNNYPLQIRENYSLLYSIYKKQKVLDTQLLYLEKLINFDSILYSNNTYVNTTLLNEYEIPNLINEKESLIKKLKYNDNKKSKQVFYLIILLVCISSLTSYFYYKRTQYKKRFNVILENKFPEEQTNQKKERKKLTVPQNIVSDIQVKLESFEQENQFLDRSISLNSLAIIFKTNSNYLSKIINYHKNQNFSSYLSQLRIQHAIQKLKEDTQFRKYDIKSIAQEVGFNSAESFSKAFYKQTGIYPSYFIKEINKVS